MHLTANMYHPELPDEVQRFIQGAQMCSKAGDRTAHSSKLSQARVRHRFSFVGLAVSDLCGPGTGQSSREGPSKSHMLVTAKVLLSLPLHMEAGDAPQRCKITPLNSQEVNTCRLSSEHSPRTSIAPLMSV